MSTTHGIHSIYLSGPDRARLEEMASQSLVPKSRIMAFGLRLIHQAWLKSDRKLHRVVEDHDIGDRRR